MKQPILVIGICLLSGLVPTTVRASQLPSVTTYSDVYTVGDSLVDPGNVYQLIGIPASPPYYEGRFSNGPVWAELLPERLGLTYNPSNNFAYGGSGAGDFHPTGLPLGARQQVTSLIGSDGVVDPNALYIISTGSNDLRTNTDIPNTVNNILESVNRLSDAGAKNFLVVGVPNFARLPASSGRPRLELRALRQLSASHNRLLKSSLNEASRSLDLEIDFLNLQSAFNQISRRPQAYGLDNISDACINIDVSNIPDPLPEMCSNPDRYLFWDNVHPSRKGHQLITEAALVSLGYQKKIKRVSKDDHSIKESSVSLRDQDNIQSVPESSLKFGILLSGAVVYLTLRKKKN
ncbi:SGNH/GDSL hydrolase family protein [Chroococcus sp. FPU101]|uniref:SGNH/GDSL hydrolase family protein n=1 Tax=Chroococcus sp. FPU101 TaxID=1974212 RepID=UPI001A8E1639|nr:SGNH/GDSL hydrolase family protein [Chroococcus sp. FPU101]GFE69558.1 GDSL family lipase [Chroococcus sp. FPU101]